MARTATAAAVAGLAAAIGAAAWSGDRSATAVRQPANAAPVAGALAAAVSDWHSVATGANAVSDEVRRNAASLEIAVVDTGADVSAPSLAAKHPSTYNAVTGTRNVADTDGHGTLVASIAAGAFSDSGLQGSGGDARLLIVKVADGSNVIRPTAEAAGIRYAASHGARIINLSFAGATTSPLEQSAIRFAVRRGALVIAAAGNAYLTGNPVEYPAALLQPVGSDGRGGAGLAVGATGRDGLPAPYSGCGSWISLAAPGQQIAGAIPGGAGYGSGTSFAAPQVAGAAALVWAVDLSRTAADVAAILKESASGRGSWTPCLGFGILDVADAVARAQGTAASTS